MDGWVQGRRGAVNGVVWCGVVEVQIAGVEVQSRLRCGVHAARNTGGKGHVVRGAQNLIKQQESPRILT